MRLRASLGSSRVPRSMYKVRIESATGLPVALVLLKYQRIDRVMKLNFGDLGNEPQTSLQRHFHEPLDQACDNCRRAEIRAQHDGEP